MGRPGLRIIGPGCSPLGLAHIFPLLLCRQRTSLTGRCCPSRLSVEICSSHSFCDLAVSMSISVGGEDYDFRGVVFDRCNFGDVQERDDFCGEIVDESLGANVHCSQAGPEFELPA